ncbi:MAG: TatD family hydrolase [Myxococcota bacterium]
MIDAHTHLDFDAFDTDRTKVRRRAREAGVTQMIVPGVTRSQWTRAQALGLPWCAGFHPEWLSGESAAEVRTSLEEVTGVVGIGECGLDARIDVPAEAQEAILRAHLEIAQARALPVVLHVVGRHGAALDLLRDYAPVAGMVHGFTGAPEVAERYLALGLHLSFGPRVTYEKAAKARRSARVVPAERLLLETDDPAHPPHGAPRPRNEPAFLALVADAIRDLRGEDIRDATAANARRLFSLET